MGHERQYCGHEGPRWRFSSRIQTFHFRFTNRLLHDLASFIFFVANQIYQQFCSNPLGAYNEMSKNEIVGIGGGGGYERKWPYSL